MQSSNSLHASARWRSASPARWRSARRTRPASSCKENSVKAIGRAYAGAAAATDDASRRHQQPGGDGQPSTRTPCRPTSPRSTSPSNSTAAAPSAAGTPLTGGDGGDAGDLDRRAGAVRGVPAHGALEGLTVGAMISAPFGLKTEYDRGWVGRYHAVEVRSGDRRPDAVGRRRHRPTASRSASA